jgi:H+-translocating NAD(P) transhydrogenase subunit alpha
VTALLAAAGFDAVEGLVIFVLATFVGFEVITRVPTLLHTPLMSGSNAISGIIVVGALFVAGTSKSTFAVVLSLIAVTLAMVNVVGGFVVTDRMLKMFRRRPDAKKPGSGGAA